MQKKIWTLSLHTTHLLVIWKTLFYLLSVLFAPNENLAQHEQLRHVCSRMCCFLPRILMLLSQQSLIIPITLQEVKHREAWCGVKPLYIESNAEQKEMKSISNTCPKAHCWSPNFSCHSTPAHCLGSARSVIHELKSYRKEPGQSLTLVIRQLNERYKDNKQKEDRMLVDRNVLGSFLFLLHWNVWRRLSTLPALQVRQGRFNVISVIDI